MPDAPRLNRATALKHTLLALAFASFNQLGMAQDSPWRLSENLGLDGNFTLSGHQRMQYESLSGNPRQLTSENDQVLLFRTAIDARYESDAFSWRVELHDQRQQLSTRDSIITNAMVNVTDILQAHVGYKWQSGTSSTDVKLGRFTADWGARRLIARNRNRNAINSFEGVEVVNQTQSGNTFKAMITRPVFRLPFRRSELLDNDFEADESDEARKFYALQAGLPNLIDGFNTELTYLGLREKNTSNYTTSKRHLDSYSVRVFRAPAKTNFDFESQTVFQTGQRIAPVSNLTTDTLDHEAWLQTLTLGYSLNSERSTRLMFELIYSTGDDAPLDDEYNRFDSLFGVARPEMGPRGLYNVYNRSNIISPAVRLTMNPSKNTNLMLAYRHFWLESDTDFWGSTGRRDVTGETDAYLGSHTEVRYRWDAIPGNLRVELGGIFMDPRGLVTKDSLYGYVATIFTF